jgi:hypothetical protein
MGCVELAQQDEGESESVQTLLGESFVPYLTSEGEASLAMLPHGLDVGQIVRETARREVRRRSYGPGRVLGSREGRLDPSTPFARMAANTPEAGE